MNNGIVASGIFKTEILKIPRQLVQREHNQWISSRMSSWNSGVQTN
jgi:hypothetical protein